MLVPWRVEIVNYLKLPSLKQSNLLSSNISVNKKHHFSAAKVASGRVNGFLGGSQFGNIFHIHLIGKSILFNVM